MGTPYTLDGALSPSAQCRFITEAKRKLYPGFLNLHRLEELSGCSLEVSESILRAILWTCGDQWKGVGDCTAPYRVTYANPALEDLCGYSADEIVGKYGLNFLHVRTALFTSFLACTQKADSYGCFGCHAKWP